MDLLEERIARWKLRRCAYVGRAPRVHGRVWIHGRGIIRLGHDVVLDGAHQPIELHALDPASEIVIGDGALLEGGASIEAVISVTIGARSRLRSFSRVLDNNFHPLQGNRHWRPPSAKVTIGEDVDVGARAILLAGATIGDGATIRAGTVINRRLRVPPHAHARGFPASVSER